MAAGDLATGNEYLTASAEHDRRYGDDRNLSIALQNWSDCLAWTGDADRARHAASEALTAARTTDDRSSPKNSYASLGCALHLAGQTRLADEAFLAADRMEYAGNPNHRHLHSLRGVWWAQLLLDTGRVGVARRLTEANHDISAGYGWNEDVARCQRLLARCDLADSAPSAAAPRLHAALATSRDGDYVLELAATLAVFAEQQRRSGHLDAAEQACKEAIALAAPRGLVPTHAAALAARARIRADRHTPDELTRARDDADHAHRLATIRHLPWQQLDALDAHAHIDQATGTDGRWAAQADRLREHLIPDDLDTDPLTTIEAETTDGPIAHDNDHAD